MKPPRYAIGTNYIPTDGESKMQILDGKAGGTKKRKEKKNYLKATPKHGCAKSRRNTNTHTHGN